MFRWMELTSHVLVQENGQLPRSQFRKGSKASQIGSATITVVAVIEGLSENAGVRPNALPLNNGHGTLEF